MCAGGALGSGARYLVSLGAARWLGPALPYGTFAVNLIGSLLLGLMLQSFTQATPESAGLRLALTTGAMGGFTTYSTFNYETLNLLSSGRWVAGGGYLLATVMSCLLAGALGMGIGRLFTT